MPKVCLGRYTQCQILGVNILGFQKSPCQEIFGELVNPYPIVFKYLGSETTVDMVFLHLTHFCNQLTFGNRTFLVRVKL